MGRHLPPDDPVSEPPEPSLDSADAVTSQVPDTTPTLSSSQKLQIDTDFAFWLDVNIRDLYRYAYFLCKDRAFAEDLVHDVALKFYRMWHDDERRNTIKERPGYAYTALKNSFIDYSRVPSRTNHREMELLETDTGADPKTVDLETIWTIRDAIQLIGDDERLLIFLVYYQDNTVSAAGRALHLDANQAHRLHKRALAALKPHLEVLRH